jgi:hypothetical protein
MAKLKKLKLFNDSYDIDVIKDMNNNDISSTSYVRGRTHYLKTAAARVFHTESRTKV